MRKHGTRPGLVLAGLLLICLPARAEDTRGRWSFGLDLGILSTTDDIRSNAAALLLNEKGISGDISDDQVQDGSTDLRQDDLLGRETSVEERQTYNLSVAYGLTSWLSLQMDVGRYEGDVTNLDTFRINRRYTDLNRNGDLQVGEDVQTPLHDASFPISVGRLEQIPVSFSAVFRFRKDSPFNPFLGAGVGMIFTDFEESEDFQDMNDRILEGFQRTQLFPSETPGQPSVSMNRQIIEDRFGNPIAYTDCSVATNDQLSPTFSPERACALGEAELEAVLAQLAADGQLTPEIEQLYRDTYAQWINPAFIPRNPFVTTHVEDVFEYHLMGGAEYHFNERWSAYVMGRYVFTRANLEVRISDNGNLVTPAKTADPSQAIHFDTDQALFRFLASSNIQAPFGEGPDQQPDPLEDEILVQGGKINLSGFTLAFGLRFTF